MSITSWPCGSRICLQAAVFVPRQFRPRCRQIRLPRWPLDDGHPASAGNRYGASVGAATIRTLSLNPDEIRISLRSDTITPSTSGSRSMSAIPASGPMTNTPVERPSAMTARLVDDGGAACAAGRQARGGIEDVVIAAAVFDEGSLVIP